MQEELELRVSRSGLTEPFGMSVSDEGEFVYQLQPGGPASRAGVPYRGKVELRSAGGSHQRAWSRCGRLSGCGRAATQSGYTPIYRAAENGHTTVVDALIAAHADVNAATKKVEWSGPARACILPRRGEVTVQP